MNKKYLSLVVTCLAIASLVFGVSELARASDRSGEGKTPAESAPKLRVREHSTALQDLPCSFTAVPDLSGSDERVSEMAKDNPVAQVLTSRYERAKAIKDARNMSTDPRVAADAPAAAVLAPASWARVANELVNPERCMWVVSVDAPYEPQRTDPFGKPIGSYPSYTVTLDAASGQGQGISAGTKALNVLTGNVATE